MQKIINTALCSYGMSGKLFHAPFLQVHPGFTLYAVWERSKKLVHERYEEVRSYSDYDELLADNAVELVIVNTPNYTHYEFAKKALLAGKHVIVEKPFVVTVAQGEELIDIAEKNSLLLSPYQNRRFDSDYRTIKKILDENLLGPIVEAEFHFDRFVEALSYKKHKETPGPGTGSLYDLGSHIIDQALQLFGWPNAIMADVAIMRPISQVDDYFELLLYYEGKRVRLRSTYVAREPIPGYVIHGMKGSFIKAKTNVQEDALNREEWPQGDHWGKEDESEWGLLHTAIDGKVIKEQVPSLQGNYLDYFDGIYQSIAHHAPLPVTAADGLKVIRIIEAAYQSSNEKRVVML